MRANFQFSKYQACGNDFIIIDTPCSERIAHEKCGEVAKVLCTGHFGIGADSLLYSKPLVCPHLSGRVKRNSIEVTTKGGKIEIKITKDDLYMRGPAIKVFDGIIKGGNID